MVRAILRVNRGEETVKQSRMWKQEKGKNQKDLGRNTMDRRPSDHHHKKVRSYMMIIMNQH